MAESFSIQPIPGPLALEHMQKLSQTILGLVIAQPTSALALLMIGSQVHMVLNLLPSSLSVANLELCPSTPSQSGDPGSWCSLIQYQ